MTDIKYLYLFESKKNLGTNKNIIGIKYNSANYSIVIIKPYKIIPDLPSLYKK